MYFKWQIAYRTVTICSYIKMVKIVNIIMIMTTHLSSDSDEESFKDIFHYHRWTNIQKPRKRKGACKMSVLFIPNNVIHRWLSHNHSKANTVAGERMDCHMEWYAEHWPKQKPCSKGERRSFSASSSFTSVMNHLCSRRKCKFHYCKYFILNQQKEH